MAAVDRTLYAANAAGRNRVVAASSLPWLPEEAGAGAQPDTPASRPPGSRLGRLQQGLRVIQQR